MLLTYSIRSIKDALEEQLDDSLRQLKESESEAYLENRESEPKANLKPLLLAGNLLRQERLLAKIGKCDDDEVILDDDEYSMIFEGIWPT